jgi:hypothetical protein
MERSRLRHILKNERKSEEEEKGTFGRGGDEKRRKKQWKCVLSHRTLTDETSTPAVAPNDCHEGEEVEKKSAATIPVTCLPVSAVLSFELRRKNV